MRRRHGELGFNETGSLRMRPDFDARPSAPVSARAGRKPERGHISEETRALLTPDIDQPAMWWPSLRLPPPIYKLLVEQARFCGVGVERYIAELIADIEEGR